VNKLFINEDPIGKLVRIDGQAYTVIGVMAPKGTAFGANQDTNAIITVTQYLEIYGQNSWRSLSLNVQAPSQETLLTTLEHAIGTMRLVRGLEPEEPNDFEVFSNDSLIEAFNQVAGIVATGAFVISAIALLASGVGVMNIMLVSVTERTREIGIRKALGARKPDIIFQFLLEASSLTILGGIIGIAFAALVTIVIAALVPSLPSTTPLWAVLAGLGVSVATGVFFGTWPAIKAARLDPVEALRYE